MARAEVVPGTVGWIALSRKIQFEYPNTSPRNPGSHEIAYFRASQDSADALIDRGAPKISK